MATLTEGEYGRTRITNPFFGRAVREGTDGLGDPTLSRTHVTNPYFSRRGRPKKGAAPTAPPVAKSIKLPPALWAQVEAQAQREGKSRHAALREAVIMWLRS